MLDRCRDLLKPGGVLVVNFPDIGSWIAKAMGRRWLFLTSVHLFYFDRSSMRRMLEAAGFTVARTRPHVQRLELDYILFRGSILSETLSRSARAMFKTLGMSRAHVPYWLGQTLMIARVRSGGDRGSDR